jgi:hypothetical protein
MDGESFANAGRVTLTVLDSRKEKFSAPAGAGKTWLKLSSTISGLYH